MRRDANERRQLACGEWSGLPLRGPRATAAEDPRPRAFGRPKGSPGRRRQMEPAVLFSFCFFPHLLHGKVRKRMRKRGRMACPNPITDGRSCGVSASPCQHVSFRPPKFSPPPLPKPQN